MARVRGRSDVTSALAVICGAGQARHYRVQVRASTAGEWRRYASFHRLELAAKCAARLARTGLLARIVRFSIAPPAG
jgi:hypothetical protein